jgi:hypothetical protein
MYLGSKSSPIRKRPKHHRCGLVLSTSCMNYRRRPKLAQNPYFGVGTLNGVKAIPTFLRRSILRVRVRLKMGFGCGDLANIAPAVLVLEGLVSIGSLTANIEDRSGEGVGWKVADIKPGQGAVIKTRGISREYEIVFLFEPWLALTVDRKTVHFSQRSIFSLLSRRHTDGLLRVIRLQNPAFPRQTWL